MTEREKMVCPDCGAEMNCHARKVDYTPEPPEPETPDAEPDGAVEELHTCPVCGLTLSRPAR